MVEYLFDELPVCCVLIRTVFNLFLIVLLYCKLLDILFLAEAKRSDDSDRHFAHA